MAELLPDSVDAGLLYSIRQLWAHVAWADRLVLDALKNSTAAERAWAEYAHILGAEETWLARIQGRSARAPIWPQLDARAIEQLHVDVVAGYETYLNRLDESGLATLIEYTNSAGTTFQTVCADILLHVALHGQYHRGKINLMLREAGLDPAPADYIAFVRGAAAAVRETRS